MPTLDDVLPQLAGATFFSLLDAKEMNSEYLRHAKGQQFKIAWLVRQGAPQDNGTGDISH